MADETLYVNGIIHTVVGERMADAMLVRADRVVAAGARPEVEAAAEPGARHVDLAGQAVVPGFNDSHAHVLWLGLTLDQVDVGAGTVDSHAGIVRALAERARSTPPGEWVLGRGYDQNTLVERRHPTRTELDAVTNDHPVVIRHTSGHVLSCNSRALTLAGITDDSDDPPGGEIERNAHGNPTGVMKEAAMDLVMAHVPPPTVAEGAAAIARAAAEAARHGITSMSDAATGRVPDTVTAFEMFERAVDEDLPVRLQIMPEIRYVAPPGETGAAPPETFRPDADRLRLSLGPVKVFADGALSTRTAAVRRPYAGDGENTGILLWPRETLEDMIARAHAAGWQIATHALGDRAVEHVLGAYRAALAMEPRHDHRHRIEHCMMLDAAMAHEIAALGIVPSLQPDIFRLGDGYLDALGIERASDVIPVATLRRAGARMAFSSDCPVIPCDPLAVVRSAVERRTPRGVRLGTAEAATVPEAIRLYTEGGAFATRFDGLKGRLERGYLADFAVLSSDPLAGLPDDPAELRVTRTVMGGRTTYEA